MLELIINSEWWQLLLGGFAANGVITQIVAITPTKKDDQVLTIAAVVIKALTGTFGLNKAR